MQFMQEKCREMKCRNDQLCKFLCKHFICCPKASSFSFTFLSFSLQQVLTLNSTALGLILSNNDRFKKITVAVGQMIFIDWILTVINTNRLKDGH